MTTSAFDKGMATPLGAVARVIYDELHLLGLKSRPWSDLSDKEKTGWIVLARTVVAVYEHELRRLSHEGGERG